jgi:signal transduction histidine kinase/DNA-binding response OmpR family regulator/HAMP domain-containing protein
MVDQLGSFASEVTRVAREVGTEGILGGQADVKGVAGTWRDLTESVNSMASNLTNQVRNIAAVTTAVANGDLSREITVDARGEILELKNTINTMVDQLNAFASEVTRVAREVGTEGKLGGQAQVRGVAGTWKDLTDSVNSMASNLTSQVRNIAQVTTAVANGDLSRKITVDVRGEILELKDTINTMVDQLNSFASEVTRVAREVGTEGKLGGQAEVRGGAGVWKDLTESVNSMASNLTTQVRGIAKVVTAVANGDLKRKLVLETKGEISELAETINGMIDTLAVFADQVTSVAREVGVEGKLGGQALVPGAAGIWRDLTNNVNQLAANLTGQVRAIAEVATAVTKGDLTRSISVQASGEVAALRDNVNTMILSLRETTRKNTDQDWLKTNLARFTRMVQGQRDLLSFSRLVMSELAPLVNAQQGIFYMRNGEAGIFKLIASYAFRERKGLNNQVRVGEGLVGQCALEKVRILMTDVPSDYIRINSGLGEAAPYNIVVLPVLFEGEVMAVIELASFKPFNEIHMAFLDQLTESIGIVLNTIAATMRTEELLKQSQALAGELRSQQEELTSTNRRLEQQAATLQASEELLKSQQEQLQRTNQELQEKARLLAEQKAEVERKNGEVEQAKEALEEKAEQLALTSKYKSEFLANMSHELRTPLNNLLILARMLADNIDGNLTGNQIKFAETIHSSGTDLLALISDILDLSKIESGTMGVQVEEVSLDRLREYIVGGFKHVADEKGLQFSVDMAPGLPRRVRTDPRRLQQVLKNLLSNAIKFTDRGRVRLRMELAGSGWTADHPVLSRAGRVIAFSVNDTGIGIAPQKQRIIFEAFQQADGTTSRKYGGTGLGLSISREIARLLGGEIALESVPNQGSTFTLYLPASYVAPGVEPREATADAGTAHPLPHSEKHTPAVGPQRAMPAPVAQTDLTDDRDSIEPGDRTVLIIEDDVTYARVILEGLHKRGLKGIVATDGASAVALLQQLKPSAITLDIFLPDTAGWMILDRLKHDPETAHIPVHVISIDQDWRRVLALGAASYVEKTSQGYEADAVLAALQQSFERNRRLLLAVGDAATAVELINHTDIEVTVLASGAEALHAIGTRSFDCVMVVPEPADMNVGEFLRGLAAAAGEHRVPVLVYTAQQQHPLSQSDARRFCETLLVKCIGSPEELIQNAAIHLHRRTEELPATQRSVLDQIRLVNPVLHGRRILVVDDDMRNLFALTSVLERYGMEVLRAEDGRAALGLLSDTEGIELVLLDIMMPGMDGYETARAIRSMDRYRDLPIIALTAKAMMGDREKCLEAGASDYVAKPVDVDQLVSVLRVWLPPRQSASARAS